ncbi:unnamed protein product [Blepharisma stoltei]|uniref:TNFR-Cys domain-containing protein n=1 Tax=Blepharisma stoltei TaxID=1481888 RepID=A0AAU9IZC9_9CILI|nr:unnamed protein product [Blepharisma stoltei]
MKKLLVALFILLRQAECDWLTCATDNGYLVIGYSCVGCFEGCKTCFGNAWWYQCNSCYPSYYFLNHLCLPIIPLQSTQFPFGNQLTLGMDVNGIFQIGSNKTNKYPDFDVNDPIPAYLRGYYFHTNSYMTSDKFNFSPWFTVSFWIKPYSNGNIFLKKDSTKVWLSLSIDSHQEIYLNMLFHNGNNLSLHMQSLFKNWNQISITCNLIIDEWFTNIQLIYNGVIASQYQTPSTDLYRDHSIGFIGNDPAVSQSFIGFLYKIGYYDNPNEGLNDYLQDLSCMSGCLFCASDFTCPDDCEFNEFNNNGTCVNCLSECAHGCRTLERCNLCETKECYSCNHFSVCNTCVTRGNLTGSVCECNLNTFFNETTSICDLCDSNFCSQCLTVNYFDCKKCEGNYQLIDGVCLKWVPTGWDSEKDKPYIAIDTQLGDGEYKEIYGFFTTGKFKNYYHPFNNPEIIDPFPIEGRGLYFSDGKYLNSSQEAYLSCSFTLIFCINPKNGDFFEKGNTSINSNGKASIFLQDPLNNLTHIITHSDFPLKNWTYFTLIVSYYNSTTTLSIYSNRNLLFLYSYYPLLFRDEELSYILLGKNQDSSYDGYIYIFQYFIGEIDILAYLSNDLILNSLPLCDYSYIYNQNSTCFPCESSCSIGCIRESNCNLCYDQLCRNCSGPYEESTCFHCAELAHNLYTNECICDDNAFFIKNSSNYYCENCDYNYCAVCDNNGHFECLNCSMGVLVDTVCLDEPPIGYYECSGQPCLVTEIDPNKGFSENYGIFISGSSKETFNHFNNHEKDDPVPTKQRGFYHDGVNMFFQTENSTYIGHIFTIGGWFWVLGTGDVLEHENRLLLASNGSLSITFQDRDLKEFTFATPGMNFSEWTYISFTVSYVNSTTSLGIFLNDISMYLWSFQNLLFRDIPDSKIFLAKSPRSYFNGFLYRFKMWNFEKIDFSFEFNDEICGIEKDSACLLLCSIDEYYQIWNGSEPSCEKCLSSCDRGCIRKDTCNICEDVLCAVCPNFGQNLCIQCVPYAYGAKKCKCIDKYCLSLDRLSCIRVPFENSTEKYWIHFFPDTTVKVGMWSDNFIINTIHPWMKNIKFIDNDNVTFSSNSCDFSPFNENFTCSFKVFVDPSYNNKNGPITIKLKYEGYIYPITFPVYYDDFSISLMNQPERLGVVFYLGYNYIQVLPDKWLSFNNDLCSDEDCTHVACEKLLSQDSISSIGKSIDCVYTGINAILIYVGHINDHTDSITFREKVFISEYNETNFKYLNIPWKYKNPPMPTSLIEPIPEVCCSCNVIFDGSRSPTRLGSLKYQWVLSDFMLWSGDDTQRIANITLESCNVADKHRQFNVTLIVTDKFGQQASSSITVNMTVEDVAISAWKDPNIQFRTDTISKLKFQIIKSPKIRLDPNYSVVWSLYNSSISRLLLGNKIYESTGIEFSYLFTQKGEYLLIVDAFFNDNTYKISANATIIATLPPPNIVLNGVNTYVYANSNITVNITASYNNAPINLDTGFAFIKKHDCSNGEFIELAGDSFKLNVFNKESRFNCSFTIKLRDYPEYESEVNWLNVVEGNIPRVYIVSQFPYLDPSSPVRLIAEVPDSLRMIIYWIEKYGHPFIAATPLNQPSMTIKENSMLCGIDYEFEIKVVDPVSFVPVKASIKRYVNCPPNSGTFEVDPSEGSALDSHFNVLFAGWSDLEGDEPFYYQVFKEKEGRIYALTPKTTGNSFQIVLGERGKTKLIGRIYDARGTFSEVEAYVNIKDTDYVDAKERSEVLLNNGADTMDSNMIISSINSVASYAFHNVQDQKNLTICVQNLVGTLNKWMNSSMPSTGLSESSTVIDAVHTLLGKSETYDKDLLLDIHSTHSQALNHTKTLDFHTYNTTLYTLDKLLDSLQTQLINNKDNSSISETDLFRLINQTYSEGSLKYLMTTNPNESPIKYKGQKYNSTTLSVDGKSAMNSIEFDSPSGESSAQIKIDTSKNSDSTTYFLSILSVAPLDNISDSFQYYANHSYVASENVEYRDGSIVISNITVSKLYSYSNEFTTNLVQSSISKNTGTLINPVLESSEIAEVNNKVSYEIVDKSLSPTCAVYDMNIKKFSFKFCRTALKENGIASCYCDIAGLVGVLPYPSIWSILKERTLEITQLDIPTVGTIPAYAIYGFFIVLYLIARKDVKIYDKFYGEDLKKKVLEANKAIIAEINAICTENENWENLLEIWNREKQYYDEDKEYENSNQIYYKLKENIKTKLESLMKDEIIIHNLLTPKNVKNYIENCIDIQNFDDLKIVMKVLWENCEKFKDKVEELFKKQHWIIEMIKLGEAIRWYKRKFKFQDIADIIRCAAIIALIKKGTNKNLDNKELKNLIEEKNNTEKLNIDKDLMNDPYKYAEIQLASTSHINLTNSLKRLNKIALRFLEKKAIPLDPPQIPAESRYILNQSPSIDQTFIEEELKENPNKHSSSPKKSETIDNNKEAGESALNIEDIGIIVGNPSHNEDKFEDESSTLLSKAMTAIENENINNVTFNKRFIEYFMMHNDILGVWGFTNLNSPREFRLTYLLVAVLTEITIAISAFDNNMRYINKEVDLIIIFKEQKLVIFLLSVLFGLIPLILKLFFRYNVLSTQFKKNKLDEGWNTSVILGFIMSWVMIVAEFCYSLSKMQKHSLNNLSAYLDYITKALILFLFTNGIILPLIIAWIDKKCGNSICRGLKGCGKYFKRFTTENEVIPGHEDKKRA